MKKKNQKNIKKIVLSLSVAALFVFGAAYIKEKSDESKVKEITYNAFVKKMNNKKIKTVYYYSKTDSTIECVDKKNKRYEFTNPSTDDFKVTLLKNGIEIKTPKSVKKENTIYKIKSIISTIYPIALIFLIYESLKGQLASNDDALDDSDKPKIKFTDVIGLEKTKEEMKFLVEFMKDPKKFKDSGVKIPAGILLYGPPGTGKTLLAKAIAGEANVPFYSKSGSDFVELYAGNGARKVRNLFKEAKKNAPCIVFIDEIDALGSKRSGAGGNSESTQTVNAFLNELGGFSGNEGILVIGATNMLDKLDPAFIRSGRFDKHICVPLPENKEERFEMFKLYSKNKKVSSDVDFMKWAKKTCGFGGADIETIMNNAALKSLMNENKEITNEDIESAFYEKLTKGQKKTRTEEENQRQLKIVAWHEAGHAVITKLLTNDEVVSVTIAGSTSGVGGFTQSIPDKQKLQSKNDILNKIVCLYGGRAAEQLFFGNSQDVTTGAENDIKVATDMINRLVTEYGMSSSYGLLNLSEIEIADKKEIMNEMKKISNSCYEKALDILNNNKLLLEKTANLLIEKETISGDELNEVIDGLHS